MSRCSWPTVTRLSISLWPPEHMSGAKSWDLWLLSHLWITFNKVIIEIIPLVCGNYDHKFIEIIIVFKKGLFLIVAWIADFISQKDKCVTWIHTFLQVFDMLCNFLYEFPNKGISMNKQIRVHGLKLLCIRVTRSLLKLVLWLMLYL